MLARVKARKWLLTSFAAVIALFLGVQAALQSHPVLLHTWVNSAWTLVSFLAGLKALHTARNVEPQHLKSAWRMIALGCFVWCGGMLIWFAYESRGIYTPFPSLADVGFMGLAPCFIAGMALYNTDRSTIKLPPKYAADIGVIVCLLVMVASIILFAPVSRNRNESTLFVFAALLRPILFFSALLVALRCLWQQVWGKRRRVILLLVLGMALQSVAATLYTLGLVTHAYRVGHALDVLWILTFAFFTWAAVEEDLQLPTPEDQAPLPGDGIDRAVPALCLAVLTLTFALFADHMVPELGPVLLIAGLGLATCLAVREWASHRIERALREDLRKQRDREHVARSRAEDAEQRSAFLAEAAQALGGDLEQNHVLEKFTELVVGRHCDWCLIDLAQDGDPRRSFGRHQDASKQPQLQELIRCVPPPGAPALSTRLLTTETPLLFTELTKADLRGTAPNYRSLLEELGTRSLLIVPLAARGHIIGSVSLASAEPGRYGQTELEFTQELARRAATAIDNAGLYRKLQETVRMRDEFLSIASHELRTPLTSLQLTVQALTTGIVAPSEENTLRAFSMAERQIDRMTRLIGELLAVSRIQSGRLSLHLEMVDLSEIVADVAQRFEAELARARTSLSLALDELVIGRWDRNRLEQVVTNLLSNAVKFGAGKPIELRVKRLSPKIAQVAVTDHGIGIQPERLSRIFGRFERAVSAREYGGLGLGLYIVRTILEQLGGKIWVESRVGVGSTFTFELPTQGPAQPIATVREKGN